MTDKKQFSSHCIQMFELYSAYIDNELDIKLTEEIKAHMLSCSECKACIASLRKTKELCNNIPDEKITKAFSEKLHNKIQSLISNNR
ncbi:MAG: hypothetical protein CSA18_02540 [Deltaproteobacteria bacterium]|nr:MAG: hypothetical protein CSB21_00925 [Deltaproteobacteria bacterium]PIE75006.1 MAG: hypothetical protein CSA18_02540 [Deltaproteobacteria bacterium]